MIPKQIPLRNEEIFKLAMRHRSAAPTNPVADSYERLEFFGDSVLGLVVAQYLYEHHPTWDQGMLSKAKSSVVKEEPLADVALKLGLQEFIELSPSEEATGGRMRPSILADTVEAIIGGIYLESGLEVARWFVLEQLHPYIMRISGGDVSPDDFKSKLQEVAQAIWRKSPSYRVAKESGFAHERRFHVQVIFDEEVIGEGSGRSKKEAEQDAARDALAVIDRYRRDRERGREAKEDPYL
ncbi:ribonuclease III [Fimbriimonas ginsengisoli]|uniref:Ribonuclease 3 n=1 Tax=Fimbriimonas ginsengisoli Gsoil 348 TaxID=661478 RepID=A0A068NQ76_FIMGI|nr:ribonuclease III [Fimbriimonas ginsengisoli]AIE85517.1 ribonuclease III [Fimbriimonas ginsengisoli Gsoil 348]